MTDRLGNVLGDIVRRNARTAITRTPRTSSSGIPTPPVLSPITNVASNVGAMVGRQAATIAPTPSTAASSPIPPPPQLSLGVALGREVQRDMTRPVAMPTSGLSVGSVGAPLMQAAGQDVIRRVREAGQQEWGVYDVDGVAVAMPSRLATSNNFELTNGASTTTDPAQVDTLKNNHISYLNMPEEVTSKIKMPQGVTVGERIGQRVAEAQRGVMSRPLPEQASALSDIASAGASSMMQSVAEAREDVRVEAPSDTFALVRHNENGTTHMIQSDRVEEAISSGQFTMITDGVTREQASNIAELTGFNPETGIIEEPGNVDSTLAVAEQDALAIDQAVRNQQALRLAQEQGVVEIGGKHYPVGTEEPIKYPEWHEGFEFQRGNIVDAASSGTRFAWSVLTGDYELVIEDMPEAPDGWVWVTDHEDVWLVEEQYDQGGNIVAPQGSEILRSEDEAKDTLVTNMVDLGSDVFVTAVETVVGGAIEHGHRVLPGPVRDAYNNYVREPLKSFVDERLPDGTVKDIIMATLDNPIAGVVLMASTPGDQNVDLITKSVLYPDDDSKLTTIGSWQKEIPFVSEYVAFLEANPEEAKRVYEEGYESSDGTMLTGVQATMEWWHDTELDSRGGSATWLAFLFVTDPLSYLFGTGTAAKGIRGAARSQRMSPNIGPAKRAAWGTVEGAARGVEVVSRIGEDIGDLGARYVLAGGAKVFNRVGGQITSSARHALHSAAVDSVAGDIGTSGAGSIGTLEPNKSTGAVELKVDDANAPTTGPMAQTQGQQAGRRRPVDPVEMDRLYDDAVGIEVGDTVDLGGTPATRTADGWEIVTPDGEIVTSSTRAGAAQQLQETPGRWRQWPIEPGREARYIDQMPRAQYDQLRSAMENEWAESVATQRASDTPGTDVPNIRHLNETDRIGWRTREVSESIDPTFQRPWERNRNGGDTLYQLSEAFRRADVDSAMSYWGAMTGGGNTVPLHNRMWYSGTSPVVRLRTPNANITSIGSPTVRAANAAVDNIFARLKYHPGDVYNPAMSDIIRQAANVDYNLRQRGLRSSGPDWAFDPLVSLIPDDAPINLRKGVRDMAAYDAPQVRVDEAGEFVGRVTLSDDGLGVDLYHVAVDQVPERWINHWVDQMPEVQGQQRWAQGIVERSADEGFTVYAPETRLAVQVADETALARGWTDFDAPERAIDHVQNVEGVAPEVAAPAQAAPNPLNDISQPRQGYEWAEAGTTPSGRTIHEQVNPNDTVGFARAFGSTDEIIGGRIHVVFENNPQRTGWRLIDNGQDVGWVEAGDLVVENGRASRANKEQVYIEADRYLDTQEAAGSPRSGVESEVGSVPDTVSVTSPEQPQASLASRIRQLLDEVEGIEPEGTVPTEAVTSVPERVITDADIVQAEQSRAAARAEVQARTSGSDPLPGRQLPELTGETVPDPTGTIDVPVRRAVGTEVTPVTEATPGSRLLKEIVDLPEDSPRLSRITAEAGGPTPATHQKLLPRDYSSATSTSDMLWLNRPIEKWQNDIITQHPFPDGETLKDRTTRYYVEEGNKGGWTGVPDRYMETAFERVMKEYEAHLIENVYPRGVLPNWAKAKIAQLPESIQKALSAAALVMRVPLRGFDRYSQWIRQRILFHPTKILHYPMVQYFGNHMLNMLAGDWRVVRYMSNPANVARAYRRVKAGDTAGWLRDGGPMTTSQRVNNRLGLASLPETSDVLRGRAVGREADHMMGGKLLTEKLGRTGEGISFFVAGSKFARDFGAAMDVVYREAIEVSSKHHRVKFVLPDYRNAQINRMVADWGLTMDEARTLWKGFEDSLGREWSFSPDDVLRYFSSEGRLPKGRAERMARDWRATLKGVQDYAQQQVRRRAMAQPQTRADLVAQRLMAFHFFQSRQLWFLANQMVNHPFLINLYVNATEELERIAEREGYPSYLTGWLNIFTGPGGRQMFLNPFALLQTYWLFDESDNFRTDADGKHRNIFERWVMDYTGIDLDLRMFGVNPGLENILNTAGISGDTWAPDLTGYGRDANILTLIMNTGRMYGLWGDDPTPRGNWLDDKTREIREWVSGINPWADQVDARSSEQSMDREIRAIMADDLAAQGIDPESDEGKLLIAEAEMNPDSDLYSRAIKKWIHGEWFEVGSRAGAGPWRPRYRLEGREGGDLMNSIGDGLRQTINTPEPMVTVFRVQQSGYYELADQRSNKAAGIWNEIANGEVKGDLVVNGITYTEDEINNMPREQRTALANGYMAENGLLDEIHAVWDERDKYLAQPENREFAKYDTWRTAVYDYEGGPEQYWQDLIKDNPTAEVYYNAMIKDEEDPRARRRMMTSNGAYFAIMGWDSYVFDKPVEAYGSPTEIWDPVGIADQQSQPIPYEEQGAEFKDEVRKLPVFQAEMEAYDTAFRDKMEAYGYDRNTPVPSLPSRVRRDIEDELKAEGRDEPSPSWQIQRYLEWVEEQPEGADTSVEAFFEANQAEYYSTLPAQTEEKVRMPQPLPSPGQYGTTPPSGSGDFWESIYWLLNEHDHNRYDDPWGRP